MSPPTFCSPLPPQKKIQHLSELLCFQGRGSGARSHRIMGAFGANTVWFVRQSGSGSGDFPHHRRMRHVLYQYLRMLRVNT